MKIIETCHGVTNDRINARLQLSYDAVKIIIPQKICPAKWDSRWIFVFSKIRVDLPLNSNSTYESSRKSQCAIIQFGSRKTSGNAQSSESLRTCWYIHKPLIVDRKTAGLALYVIETIRESWLSTQRVVEQRTLTSDSINLIRLSKKAHLICKHLLFLTNLTTTDYHIRPCHRH